MDSNETRIISGANVHNKSVLQIFEECVQKFNHRIAISTSSQQITYADLNKKSNNLAFYIKNNGVTKDTVVAIYIERSIEFIIAVLSIIKTGAAYLPLDIDTPINRQEIFLKSVNPIVILTNFQLKISLNKFCDLENQKKVLVIDKIIADDFNENLSIVSAENNPDDLLYIMFTSGTTGTPKGCMIPHKAVINLVTNTNYVQISSSDKISQLSNAAFDAMTFEMWGALLNGAQLHIISKMDILEFEKLSTIFQQENITISFFTTSLLNLIIKNHIECFDKLRYLLFGGEKANAAFISLLLSRKISMNLNELNIINAYGPTECTTFSLFFNIKNKNDIARELPIGKPIQNVEAYILNSNLQSVSDNQVGELYIGGKGLALGYLNSQRETSAKFIFHPNHMSRIYKTGDIVYKNTKNEIIFIGRNDTQIKIRGFRIELSEVEYWVSKFAGIDQVSVDVECNSQGDNYLIAYFNLLKSNEFQLNIFRQYLNDNLPYYMIPSKLYQVSELPLTNNGKIDRLKLKTVSKKICLQFNFINQPKNEIEKIISQIWKELLHFDDVSLTQNFFDMGAHSLMVNEACYMINAKLLDFRKINVIDIYTYPTIKSLSDYIITVDNSSTDNISEDEKQRTNKQKKILLERKKRHAVT